ADGDGLMDNARAGAGAIEVGDLQQGLKSDVYMAAVWVKALEVFPRMALAMREPQVADEARRLPERALATLRDTLLLSAERATGFDALGLFRYHNAAMGWAATSAVARTAFLWGLGDNPEVLSGSVYEPLETAVPQQFFATSMLLTPLVRGLLGWEADVPADRV